MKKLLALGLVLALSLFLAACSSSAQSSSEVDSSEAQEAVSSQEQIETNPKIVMPLEETLDVNDLGDSIFRADFNSNEVKSENGVVSVNLDVQAKELFDLVDVSLLEVGDTIYATAFVEGELYAQPTNVVIESIETKGNYVVINGGPEEGGCYLFTEEDGVYYSVLPTDDTPYFHSVGTVTLPLSKDFVFTDGYSLEVDPVIMNGEEFVAYMGKVDISYLAYQVTVHVANNEITEIIINYVP